MVCPSLCLRAAGRKLSICLCIKVSINLFFIPMMDPWDWYIYLHEGLFLMVKCGKCIGKYTILSYLDSMGYYSVNCINSSFFLVLVSIPKQNKKNNAWKSLIPSHMFANFFQGEIVVQFYRDIFLDWNSFDIKIKQDQWAISTKNTGPHPMVAW